MGNYAKTRKPPNSLK